MYCHCFSNPIHLASNSMLKVSLWDNKTSYQYNNLNYNQLLISTIDFNLIFRIFLFVKRLLFLPLCRASLLRSAPFELPQGGNEARVEGCSGAIKVACPFFSLTPERAILLIRVSSEPNHILINTIKL